MTLGGPQDEAAVVADRVAHPGETADQRQRRLLREALRSLADAYPDRAALAAACADPAGHPDVRRARFLAARAARVLGLLHGHRAAVDLLDEAVEDARLDAGVAWRLVGAGLLMILQPEAGSAVARDPMGTGR